MANQEELNLDISQDQKARDKWAARILEYDKSFEKFNKRGESVIARYRNEREGDENSVTRRMRYNILWANTEVLGPAVLSKSPKVQVNRRYHDKDPIGRIACAVLERSVAYEMDITDWIGEAFKSRDDYLLVGRGTLWQRYEPIIETQGEEVTEHGEDSQEDMGLAQLGKEAIGANGGPPLQEVIGENAPMDYVHWKDFLHGVAQTWKQVTWVGRKVLMDKKSCDARWPELIDGKRVSQLLSFTHRQEKDPPQDNSRARTNDSKGNLALIYEFWDKETFKACWYSPDLKTRLIEEVDDPLELYDFFPCPEPMYATTTTDRLIPVADYMMYQDQALELDIITQRISMLVKACAVRGVYDKSNQQLADLLNERPENYMVGVDNWAAFAEKGGLQGQMSFVPIDQVIKVITGLQAARQVVIQDIYAITGISDIIRGNSDPGETATAQEIKGQYANMRLTSRRDKMNKFLRDALRIMSEVICEHFAPETLRKTSGFDLMTEVQDILKEKGPEEVEKVWQQVYEMLKNDPLRLTHLDIETNSMVERDQQLEQQQRSMFLEAAGSFLKEAVAAGQQVPELSPLLGEMLLFGVRGFNVGRELEGSFEAALEKLQKAAAHPQPKPPSADEIKAQVEQARLKVEEARAQGEQARNKQDIANDQAKNTLEMQKQADATRLKEKELQDKKDLAILEMQLKYGIKQAEAAASAENEAERLLQQGTQSAAELELARQDQSMAAEGQAHSQKIAEESLKEKPNAP